MVPVGNSEEGLISFCWCKGLFKALSHFSQNSWYYFPDLETEWDSWSPVATQNGCQVCVCVFSPLFWVTPCNLTLATCACVCVELYSVCCEVEPGQTLMSHWMRTVGQRRKWKCHVNVFVMQWDHVVWDRGCLWFMLCQSVSLSNNKMAFLGLMLLWDYYLENIPPHIWD